METVSDTRHKSQSCLLHKLEGMIRAVEGLPPDVTAFWYGDGTAIYLELDVFVEKFRGQTVTKNNRTGNLTCESDGVLWCVLRDVQSEPDTTQVTL